MEVRPDEFLRAFPSAKAALDQKDLAQLLAVTTPVRKDTAAVLFEAGEPSDGAYLLLDGKVRIRRTLDSGRPITLALLCRGHIVGDMGLVAGAPRGAAAVVELPIHALHLDQEAWAGLRGEAHPAAMWLLAEIDRRMSERIDTMYDRITRVAKEPHLATEIPNDEPSPPRWWERWLKVLR